MKREYIIHLRNTKFHRTQTALRNCLSQELLTLSLQLREMVGYWDCVSQVVLLFSIVPHHCLKMQHKYSA